jgi:hypothetical protein
MRERTRDTEQALTQHLEETGMPLHDYQDVHGRGKARRPEGMEAVREALKKGPSPACPILMAAYVRVFDGDFAKGAWAGACIQDCCAMWDEDRCGLRVASGSRPREVVLPDEKTALREQIALLEKTLAAIRAKVEMEAGASWDAQRNASAAVERGFQPQEPE